MPQLENIMLLLLAWNSGSRKFRHRPHRNNREETTGADGAKNGVGTVNQRQDGSNQNRVGPRACNGHDRSYRSYRSYRTYRSYRSPPIRAWWGLTVYLTRLQQKSPARMSGAF